MRDQSKIVRRIDHPVKKGERRSREETGGGSRSLSDRLFIGLLRPDAMKHRAAMLAFLIGLIAGVRLVDREIGTVDPQWRWFGPGASRGQTTGERDDMRLYSADSLRNQTHRFVKVSVTGYTSCPAQTDDTPFVTATLHPTRPGTLALSRDLLRTFTLNAPFEFGDRVLIPGMGIYVVEDTMHPRWQNTADIWFHDNETALRWGRREVFLTLVDADEPHLVAAQWHPPGTN